MKELYININIIIKGVVFIQYKICTAKHAPAALLNKQVLLSMQ